MKVYTTTDNSGLIWTDPEVFKRFAIGPLIFGADPSERKAMFDSYMKMSADDLVNHRDTAGCYKVFDSDYVDDKGSSFDINDKNLSNNLSLRDLYNSGDDTDPFDADLYDVLDSDITVTKTDVNDDGDTDKVTIDAADDGQPEVEIESTDDQEEQDALNKLDDAADKAAEKNPISIDKVDAMADEAANDNDLSLDKVDAMADEAAHSRDSTGNVADYEKKKTPEQLALEALVSGRQKNILAALQDRLM